MKTVLDLPTGKIDLDVNKKMAIATFNGDVSFEDYKRTLLGGAELARRGTVDSVIMDRRDISKLDAECRLWVKNEYLKVHVKPLIPKMRKVAVIQSKTILGQVYGQTIYKTLSMFYPNLTFKSFTDLKDAVEWICPTEITGNMVVEDFIQAKEKLKKKSVDISPESQEIKPIIISKKPIIQENKQNENVLEVAGAKGKQSSSFFDKVFHALFPGS